MHCETLKIALATKYILFYAFITEGLQNATIWNTLHKVGNQYQSFTTLGLDPVSSSPPRIMKLHYTMWIGLFLPRK